MTEFHFEKKYRGINFPKLYIASTFTDVKWNLLIIQVTGKA